MLHHFPLTYCVSYHIYHYTILYYIIYMMYSKGYILYIYIYICITFYLYHTYVLYISLLFYFIYIMYIIYFIYIKYIFHLYGFQVLVLKLLLIENTSFICTNRVNLLCSRSNSDKPVIVAKGFLNLLSLLKLKR